MATKKTTKIKRTQIKDIPDKEQELTKAEAGKVKGGGKFYDIKTNVKG